MKHRILSDPLQEARPSVGSLWPLCWAQGLFYPEEKWTINSSSRSRLQIKLRMLQSVVGCCLAVLCWCWAPGPGQG